MSVYLQNMDEQIQQSPQLPKTSKLGKHDIFLITILIVVLAGAGLLYATNRVSSDIDNQKVNDTINTVSTQPLEHVSDIKDIVKKITIQDITLEQVGNLINLEKNGEKRVIFDKFASYVSIFDNKSNLSIGFKKDVFSTVEDSDNVIFASAAVLGDGISGGNQFIYFDLIKNENIVSVTELSNHFEDYLTITFNDTLYSVVYNIPEECFKLDEGESREFTLNSLKLLRSHDIHINGRFQQDNSDGVIDLNTITELSCDLQNPYFGTTMSINYGKISFIGISPDLSEIYFTAGQDRTLFTVNGYPSQTRLGKVTDQQIVEFIDKEGVLKNF